MGLPVVRDAMRQSVVLAINRVPLSLRRLRVAVIRCVVNIYPNVVEGRLL